MDSARTANGDGKTWATAFRAIEPALTTASNFDTIRIARGTYAPTANPALQNVGFTLKPGMTLQGGFASGGATRNASMNVTLLTGDFGRDDIVSETGYQIRGTNFRHVLSYDAASSQPLKLTLEGLSVAGGDGVASGKEGGALWVVYGSLEMKNCRIFGNQASSGGAVSGNLDTILIDSTQFIGNKAARLGGAFYVSGNFVSMKNTVFLSNTAVDGGAIRMKGHYLKLENSTVKNQQVSGEGAGIYFQGDSVRVSGCSFENLEAMKGDGGAVRFDGRLLDLTRNTFKNCRAESLGGGVRVRGNKLTAAFNRFEANTAKNGGGMLAYAELLSMDSCQFIGNVGTEKGGGLSFGSDGELNRMVFAGNRARIGGGAFGGASSRAMRLVQSRFAGNRADSGGAGAFDYGQVILDSCVLMDNSAAKRGGGLYVFYNIRLFMENSLVQGNTALNGGGVYDDGGVASDFINTRFVMNAANLSGGAIMSAVWDSGYVDRCMFLSNSADTGSAVRMYSTSYGITNSIFFKNQAGVRGTVAGLAAYPPVAGAAYGPYVHQNLFYQNRAGHGTGGCFGFKNSSPDAPQISGNIFWGNSKPQTDSVSSNQVQKNIIQDIGPNFLGNFSADPQFVAPAAGDFRLRSNSPAINALSAQDQNISHPLDFFGNPRLFGTSMDIGPVEYQGEPFAAPILLSRLDHLKLLPGKTLVVDLDSVDALGNPVYVRFSGPLATLQFNVVAADTSVAVEYNPLRQTLAITPKAGFVPGQVKLMTLKAVHPTRPDLFDQKIISLEMGAAGFDIRGVALAQNDSGLFLGDILATGNAYPLNAAAGRIFLGSLPAGATAAGLATYPYLKDIGMTESSLSIARGGFVDPGHYGFQFNGSTAMVFLPGNKPTGLTLAEWAGSQAEYRSTGRLAFTLPVTDGFEPARLVTVTVSCRFERPVTRMRVVENHAHEQTLQWVSFARPLKALTLWVTPQGPGAGPGFTRTIPADSLSLNQTSVAGLQDARSYHYRLIAVDVAGNTGISELFARTPSDNYTLGGSFSGLWVARNTPMAVYVDHFVNEGWMPLLTIPVTDSVLNDWHYDGAQTGEKYRVTFKVPGFFAEPSEHVVKINRASGLGLNFRLSAKPVIARDSVKVEQRLGNGNLVVTARTAKLFVEEKPVRLKLRWEGGFPERQVDSQEIAVSGFVETALGDGRAVWTLEIPRAQIESLILDRTHSFDRDVRYLGCELVTSAFGFDAYRAGTFDFPASSGDKLIAFAPQLYAKPTAPWLGRPVAYSRDAIIPVVGGLGNPGVTAEVSLRPLATGLPAHGVFPISQVGRSLTGSGSTSLVPCDFALATRLGADGDVFRAAVGLRFPASGQGSLLRATAVTREAVVWQMRLLRKGAYRPFVHLARRADKPGLLRLTRISDRASVTFTIAKGDSGWLGAKLLDGNDTGASEWSLASEGNAGPWVDALALSMKTGFFSPSAPKVNLEQLPPQVETGSKAMARGFALTPDQDYEATVTLRDAFGNVSDTSRITLRTLDSAYSGAIALQQDTATGALRLTLPPSGQAGLTATLVRFSFAARPYEIAVQVPVRENAPTEVIIPKSAVPLALRANPAFTRTPVYTLGEVVWQRAWAPSLTESTRIQVTSCGACSQCTETRYSLWNSLASAFVCTTDRAIQNFTAVVKEGVPFEWPGQEATRSASQSYLTPNLPTWKHTGLTAHEVRLETHNLDSSAAGGSRRQLQGRIELSWKPGSRCEDSSRTELPFHTRFRAQAGWILLSPNFDASRAMQVGGWRALPANPGPAVHGTRHQWLDVKDAAGFPIYGGFVPNLGDSITHAELFGSTLSGLPRLTMAIHVDSLTASRDATPGEQWQVWLLAGAANGATSRRLAVGLDGLPLRDGEVSLAADASTWVKGPKVTLMAGDHNLELFMLEDGVKVAGMALKKSDQVPSFTARELPRWGQDGFSVAASLSGLPSGTDITVKSRAVDRFGNASPWTENHYRTLSNDLPPALLTVKPLDTLYQGFILSTTPAFDVSLSQDYPDSLGLAVILERASGGLPVALPAPQITVESRNHWRLQIPVDQSLAAYPGGDWVSELNSYRLWVRPVQIAGDTGDATRLLFGIRSDSATVPMQPTVLKRTFTYSPHLQLAWLQGLEIDSTTLVGDLVVGLTGSNVELPGQRILLRGATVRVDPLIDSTTGKVLADSAGNRYFKELTRVTGGVLDLELCPEAGECQARKTMTVPLGKYMAELRLDSLHFLATATGFKLGIEGMRIRDDHGAWARASGDPLLSTAVPLTSQGFTDSVYVHEDEFHIGRLVGAIQGSPGFGLTACRAKFFTALTDSGPMHSVKLEGACANCGPYLEFTAHDQANGDTAFSRRDALTLPVELTALGFTPYSMRFEGGSRNTYAASRPDTVGYGGLGLILNRYAFDNTGIEVQDFDVVLPSAVFPDTLNPSGAVIKGQQGLRLTVADTANGHLVFSGEGRPIGSPKPATLQLPGAQRLRVGGDWFLRPGMMTPSGSATVLSIGGDSLWLPMDGEAGAFADDSGITLALRALTLTQGKVTELSADVEVDARLRRSTEDAAIRLRAKLTTAWIGEGLRLDAANNGRDSLFCLEGGWFKPGGGGLASSACLNGVFQLDDQLRLQALEGQYAFDQPAGFTPRQIQGLDLVQVQGFSLRLQGGEARVVMQDPVFDWVSLTETSGNTGAVGRSLVTEDVTADAGGELMTLTAGAQIPKEFRSLGGLGGFGDFAHKVFDLEAEHLSLGLKEPPAGTEKSWLFKAKGALLLGAAFHPVGLEGARIRVEDLTLTRSLSGSGVALNSLSARMDNDQHRFVMVPEHPWIEFLTAGGGLRYDVREASPVAGVSLLNQISLENWTVGFTDSFPIEDLRGLRLLIESLKIDVATSKITTLKGSAEYVPPGGALNFPGFSLSGVKMGLGSDDKGGYAEMKFDKIRFGADEYTPSLTDPTCTKAGRIYFDGNFQFNVCIEVNTRIPVYPIVDEESLQKIYLAGGQDGNGPALLKIQFNSQGDVKLSMENLRLKSVDPMPGINRQLDMTVDARVGYDIPNHRFKVEQFSGRQSLAEPFLKKAPFEVVLDSFAVGYDRYSVPLQGKSGTLFTFALFPTARFTAGSACDFKMRGYAGLVIDVDHDQVIEPIWKFSGDAECSVEGLHFVMEGFTLAPDRVGFEKAALSLDDAVAQATKYFGDSRQSPNPNLGLQKPIITKPGFSDISVGAYFKGWYLVKSGGDWTLQPGDVVPTFAGQIKFKVLDQTVRATVDFTGLFRERPEIAFKQVVVQTNSTLGGYTIPTGFSVRINGVSPWLHAREEWPRKVILPLPKIALGKVGLQDAEIEFGLSDDGKDNWYLRGKAGLALQGLFSNAEVGLELEEPSGENQSGLRKARVLIRLAPGARIPLGTTPFYIAGFEGAIYDGSAVPEGAIACDIGNLPNGLKMEAAMLIEFQNPEVANGDLGFWIHLQQLNLGINGELKMLKGVANAKACVALYRGGSALHGKFQVEADQGMAMRGLFVVDIWSDNAGGNLTSTATAELGLKRGSLFKSRWLKIPGSTKYFGGISTKMGKFDNEDNGFTGGVRALGKTWGVGVIGGDFKVGNVGKYRLKQAPLMGVAGAGLRKSSALAKSAATAAVTAALADTVPGLAFLPLGIRLTGDEVVAVSAAVDSGGGLPDLNPENVSFNTHNTWPEHSLRVLARNRNGVPGYTRDDNDSHYVDLASGHSPAQAEASENTLSRVWQNPAQNPVTDSLGLAVPRMPAGRDREKYEYQVFAGLRAPVRNLFGSTGSDGQGAFIVLNGTLDHFQRDTRILERGRPDEAGAIKLDTLFKVRHEFELGMGLYAGEGNNGDTTEAAQFGINSVVVSPAAAEGAAAAKSWLQVPGVTYDTSSRTLTFNQVKVRPPALGLGRYAFRVDVLTRDFSVVRASDNGQPETRRRILPDSVIDSTFAVGQDPLPLMDREGHEAILAITDAPALAPITPLTATSGVLARAPWSPDTTVAGSQGADERRTVFLRWTHSRENGPVGYRLTVMPTSCGLTCTVADIRQFAFGPSDHFEMTFPTPSRLAVAQCVNAETGLNGFARACGDSLVRALEWFNQGEYSFSLTPTEGKWNPATRKVETVERRDLAVSATARLGVAFPGENPATLVLSLPPGDSTVDGLPVYRLPRNESRLLTLDLVASSSGLPATDTAWQYAEASALITQAPAGVGPKALPLVGAERPHFALQATRLGMNQPLTVRMRAIPDSQTCGQAQAKRCTKDSCRTQEALEKGPCPDGVNALVREKTPNGLYRMDMYALQALARENVGPAPATTVKTEFYVQVTAPRPVLQNLEPGFVRVDKADTLRLQASGVDTGAVRLGRYRLLFFDSVGAVLGESLVQVDGKDLKVIVDQRTFNPRIRSSIQSFAALSIDGLVSQKIPLDLIQVGQDLECQDKEFPILTDRINAMDYLGIYPRYVGMSRSEAEKSDSLVLRISQATELKHNVYNLSIRRIPGGDSIPITGYAFDRDGVRFALPSELLDGQYRVMAINDNIESRCIQKGASTNILVYTKPKPAFTYTDPKLCITNPSPYRRYWFQHLGHIPEWTRLGAGEKCIDVKKSDRVTLVSTDLDGNNPDTVLVPVVKSVRLMLVDGRGQPLGDSLDVARVPGPITLQNPELIGLPTTERVSVAAVNCYRLNQDAPVCGEAEIRLKPSDRGILAVYVEYRPYDGSPGWTGPVRYIVLYGPAVAPLGGAYYAYASDVIPPQGVLPALLLPRATFLATAKSVWSPMQQVHPLRAFAPYGSPEDQWLAADSLSQREAGLSLTADTLTVAVAAPRDTLLTGAGQVIPGRLGGAKRLTSGAAISESIRRYLPAEPGFTFQTWLRTNQDPHSSLLDFTALDGIDFNLSGRSDGGVRLRVGSDSSSSLPGVLVPQNWQHVGLVCRKLTTDWHWQVVVNGIVVLERTLPLARVNPLGSGTLTLLQIEGGSLDYELLRLRPQAVAPEALALVYRAERDRRDALRITALSSEVTWKRDIREGDAWRSDGSRYLLTDLDEALRGGQLITLPGRPMLGNTGEYVIDLPGPAEVHAVLAPEASYTQGWLGPFAPAAGGAYLRATATGEVVAARHYVLRATSGITLRIPKNTSEADLPVLIFKPETLIPPIRISVVTPGLRLQMDLGAGALLYPDREDTVIAAPAAWRKAAFLMPPFAQRADGSAELMRFQLQDRAVVHVLVPSSFVTAAAWFMRHPWRRMGELSATSFSDGVSRTEFSAVFAPGPVSLPGLVHGISGLPATQLLAYVTRPDFGCLIADVDPAWGATDCLPVGVGSPAALNKLTKLTSLPPALQGAQSVVPHPVPSVPTACFTLAQAAEVTIGLPESAVLPALLPALLRTSDANLGAFTPTYATAVAGDGTQYRLYRRGALSGRLCLDLGPVSRPAPLIFARALPARPDSTPGTSAPLVLDVGAQPYLDRLDVRVIAVPDAMQGAVLLPTMNTATRCDTLSLSLSGPSEAFVAFAPAQAGAFALYLEAQGWTRLPDSLVLTGFPGARGYVVYHRFNAAGGAQLPGRGCFDAAPGAAQWVLAVRPLPGISLGLRAEEVHAVLMGGDRSAASRTFRLKRLDISLTRPNRMANSGHQLSLQGAVSPQQARGREDTLQVWSLWLDTLIIASGTQPVRIRRSALLPDLMPQWVDVDSVRVSTASLRVSGEIRVQVANKSDAAAYRRFAILIYQDGDGDYRYTPEVDSLISRAIVMGLAANEEATYVLPLSGRVIAPEQTFMALVDADGFIAETQEENNQMASLTVCEKVHRDAVRSVAADSAWLLAHTGVRAARFYQAGGAETQVAFARLESLRAQNTATGANLFSPVPWPGLDTLTVRDVAGDGRPEYVLPAGVVAGDGRVLLDARTCAGAQLADSLNFDFNGDGEFEALTCEAGHVAVRADDGRLVAILGGNDHAIPNSLVGIPETTAEAHPCLDLSLSYARVDTTGLGAAGSVRFTLRLANGGEIPEPRSLGGQLSYMGSGGWIPLTLIQPIPAPLPGQYVDWTQEVDMPDAALVPGTRFRVALPGLHPRREIDTLNNTMEFTWPLAP